MSSLVDRSRQILEAKLKSADLPPSTCGLVGIYCMCEALDVSYEMSASHLKFITHRANRGSVGMYLASRYCAGMTAATLAEAAEEISYNAVYSRFFPTRGVPAKAIAGFLRQWLPLRCVIVLTLNPQRLDTDTTPADKLTDAWHHHPLGEAIGQGFRMMYPDVTYSCEELQRMLDCESAVMVKEQDILFQTCPRSKGVIFSARRDFGDVDTLKKHNDKRWTPMGTIDNLYELQSRSGMLYFQDEPLETSLLDPSKRIKIPAAYEPGITVFVRRDDVATRELLDSCKGFNNVCTV
ncbi:uncharacterized protein LOC129596167 isoform X2 [Paramacrobiotus metropolitanus]|nr:uncharacterized protein LOC129596167 isoform X2 [Paramacrobiotus metropolitanus]